MVWWGDRKGRAVTRGLARLEAAQDAVDLGGLQGLLEAQRRQDAGQAPGQHGLARPRRPHHQDVVAAGGGDEQGPLRRLLAPDLPEVHLQVGRSCGTRSGGGGGHRGQGLPAGQKLRHLGQVLRGINLDALDHRGLPGVVLGEDEGQARLPGGQGHGEHPPGGFQAAVQGELAEKQDTAPAGPGVTTPWAVRMPTATGRSKPVPSLRTSAGARLMVMRLPGNL